MLSKMHVSVIGGGLSGLSAACYAAKAGYHVDLFEKNDSLGGRARVFHANGFTFDMGPSWYWMPDVFESFYRDFGYAASDFYRLVELDPGFRVIFGKDDIVDIPAGIDKISELFESIEKGSAAKLKTFLTEGEYKYRVSMEQFIFKPGLSLFEYANRKVLTAASRMHFFQSMRQYVRKQFKDPRLVSILEFPVLFLGAEPSKIPALYSLMNYAAFSLGTWYPMGGMYEIVKAMETIGRNLGVEFRLSEYVTSLKSEQGKIKIIETNKSEYSADMVIGSADYNHVDSKLLDAKNANYGEKYWATRTMAPSCLLFYIGINGKADKLLHHNLFFDTDFEKHTRQIYTTKQWPDDPLFYVCCPSKTDPGVAPEGKENLFILVPLAPGIEDTANHRNECFTKVMRRLESFCGHTIADRIIYNRSYCVSDFISDYNAFKGNAYGLANTLRQTAVLKPRMKNRKIKNLIYTGQLTVPGPGVPPAIISGKIAIDLAKKMKI